MGSSEDLSRCSKMFVEKTYLSFKEYGNIRVFQKNIRVLVPTGFSDFKKFCFYEKG